MEFGYEEFQDKYSYKKCKLLFLEVVNYCNFRCIHCYANLQNENIKYLSEETLDSIVNKFEDRHMDVRITGGEPFLNKDINSILEIVANNFTPINSHSVVTNGTFELKDVLHALSLGFEIQISLYGTNEESFNYFTQTKNNYEKVLNNLLELSKTEYKNRIVIQISCNKTNFSDISTFISFINSLGFKYNINRPASVGRAVENWKLLELENDQKRELAKMTKSKMDFCFHLCQLHWAAIDVNGNVTPCTFLRSKKNVMGNIFKNNFNDIWNCEKYKNFRLANPNLVDKCRDCEFEFVCSAGCAGETAGFTSNFYNSYPWCIEKPFLNNYLFIKRDQIYEVDKLAAGIFDYILIN